MTAKKISWYGQSFIGRRSVNQDSFFAEKILDHPKSFLFAIADGMGGTFGGEVASRLTIRILKKQIINDLISCDSQPNLKTILFDAIVATDNEIQNRIEKDPKLYGMGCTLTCLLISENKYVIGNIGDSRTYLFSDKKISQITKDHSAVEEYQKKHGKKADIKILQKYGHVVTKVLTGSGDKPDIFPENKEYFTIKENQGFILCSDGIFIDDLNSNIDWLYDYGTSNYRLKRIVESVIAHAYRNGSKDNISAIFVKTGKIKTQNSKRIKLYKYPPRSEVNKLVGYQFLYPAIILLIPLIIILLFLIKNDNSKTSFDKGPPELLVKNIGNDSIPFRFIKGYWGATDTIKNTIGFGYPDGNIDLKWGTQGSDNVEYLIAFFDRSDSLIIIIDASDNELALQKELKKTNLSNAEIAQISSWRIIAKDIHTGEIIESLKESIKLKVKRE